MIKKLEILLNENESEYLDFKEDYHSNNIDLLHDILCLANAESSNHRFLVFGVADDRSIIGIEKSQKKKRQCEILNLLKDSPFNHLPQITLHTIPYEGHEIDVLVIQNRAEKPYFFTKDKTFQGKTIRAGVTYSRYGDTNTPLGECVDELFLERMFRERLGLDKPPLEKVKINLLIVDHWKYSENESGGAYFYDEWNPEFTLSQKLDSSTKFIGGWNLSFPDSTAYQYELLLKFHSTVLRRLFIVSCDGGRYVTVLPNHWLYKDKITQQYYESNFFIDNSLEFLVNEMIQTIHPAGIRYHGAGGRSYRGWMSPFPIFPSENEAKAILQADYVHGMQKYTYYFFNRDIQRYVRVQEGQSHEMLTC